MKDGNINFFVNNYFKCNQEGELKNGWLGFRHCTKMCHCAPQCILCASKVELSLLTLQTLENFVMIIDYKLSVKVKYLCSLYNVVIVQFEFSKDIT